MWSIFSFLAQLVCFIQYLVEKLKHDLEVTKQQREPTPCVSFSKSVHSALQRILRGLQEGQPIVEDVDDFALLVFIVVLHQKYRGISEVILDLLRATLDYCH